MKKYLIYFFINFALLKSSLVKFFYCQENIFGVPRTSAKLVIV